MLIANIIIAFASVVMGYYCQTQSATLGAVTDLLTGGFWAIAVYLFIMTPADYFRNRPKRKGIFDEEEKDI